MVMTDCACPVGDPAPLLSSVSESLADAWLSTDELGSRIVALSGRLAAATCRFLLLVAEFDAREGCCRFGMASTARGCSTHAARRNTVRGLRTVEDQNDGSAGRREQYVRRGWTGESQYRISARLDPEARCGPAACRRTGWHRRGAFS
jgi:hypothetical protein